MNRLWCCAFCCLFCLEGLGQSLPHPGIPSPTAGLVLRYERQTTAPSSAPPFEERLKPFYHGVASGDPLPDGIILWTRVTPDGEGTVPVTWRIATDPALQNVVQSGQVTTDVSSDYTVKVDVRGLEPGTTYYYGFTALGRSSLTGRTRTTPDGTADHLRFAVLSCANYPAGYFNAYARVAERADLDAVFHLGDYLYEYDATSFGSARAVEPPQETVTLDDYRIRHSFYKLDPDLRRAHQQHPFIAVWDDHDVANNAYVEGAQNHQPDTEGDWQTRVASAKKAYFEWMPVRQMLPPEDERIYRMLSYGDLADIFVIDTRLEGREKQLIPEGGFGGPVDTLAWFAEDRTLLGASQFAWLTERLSASTARWKLIGNQVMLMQLAPNPLLPPNFTFTNLDLWDGYPAERARLLGFIEQEGIGDVVVLTGDIHSSWAGDLPLDPFAGYSEATGEGSLGVEFVSPSITSATFGDVAEANGLSLDFVRQVFSNFYPQLKSFDLTQHGYYLLDVQATQVQADWFYVDIDRETDTEREGAHLLTRAGTNRLTSSTTAAPEKTDAPALAPTDPPGTNTAAEDALAEMPSGLVVVGNYPNPTRGATNIHYVLSEARPLRIRVFDVLGREVLDLLSAVQPPGIYLLHFDASSLPSGTYFYRFEMGEVRVTRTLIVEK